MVSSDPQEDSQACQVGSKYRSGLALDSNNVLENKTQCYHYDVQVLKPRVIVKVYRTIPKVTRRDSAHDLQNEACF